MGLETSDCFHYDTENSRFELQWLPVYSTFGKEDSKLYGGQSSIRKRLPRKELIIRHAEIFGEPPP